MMAVEGCCRKEEGEWQMKGQRYLVGKDTNDQLHDPGDEWSYGLGPRLLALQVGLIDVGIPVANGLACRKYQASSTAR